MLCLEKPALVGDLLFIGNVLQAPEAVRCLKMIGLRLFATFLKRRGKRPSFPVIHLEIAVSDTSHFHLNLVITSAFVIGENVVLKGLIAKGTLVYGPMIMKVQIYDPVAKSRKTRKYEFQMLADRGGGWKGERENDVPPFITNMFACG